MVVPPKSIDVSQIAKLAYDLALNKSAKDTKYSEKLKNVSKLEQIVNTGIIGTIEPLLPLCLNLKGKPYNLKNHYPFSPVFKTALPSNLILKTGRQVSKSTSVASHGVMLSNCIPHFSTLYITPRYEQIRRFSNNYVRKFIDTSPIRALWADTKTENSVLQRSFRNLSMMIFSFALMDVDRVRGISADKIVLDEIQDIDPDHIPIIKECMSHSEYGLFQFTGTPKTLDNPLEGLWRQSSQAEWFVPCFSCNTWNIPSLEYHIYDMLGKYHDDISEHCPAVVCHRCRKPIFPRQGHWVHKYRERRYTYAGYHVPQIIMPLHYSKPIKWRELLAKQAGWGNTTQAMFANEVFGESVDSGQKLISETELQGAALLPWENKPKDPDPLMLSRIPQYKNRVLAVDWGGGGEAGVSFTVLALLGYTPSGQIHILWGKRLVASQDHLAEAKEIHYWLRKFKCDFLTHDYTGAGVVRETVLVQAGFNLAKVMAVQYVRSAASNLIKYVAPTALHNRAHYRLDKTRSLLYTLQALKLKLVRTFKYDKVNEEDPGLLADFLALIENKQESRTGSDIYTITRNLMLSDDFAQAVNIGCACLWHINNNWPNYADAASIGKIHEDQLPTVGNAEYGWEQDPIDKYRI